MSSFPQHEENMSYLFEMYPELKENLKSQGYNVDDHFGTWNYDDLVEIMSEVIALMKRGK
jgi:hypothetical protein